MGRVYSAIVDQVAVTALQDLFVLTAAATHCCEILAVRIGQGNLAADANAEMLEIELNRYVSATGGTAVTEQPHEVGHPTADAAVVRNDTTLGTTPTLLHADTFNIQAGWIYMPVPEERIWVPPSGVFAVTLPAAPDGSTTISATLTWNEIG